MGWERVDFAEDVGQFAIRGGVLDMVFENMALRFVLDGDVIEDVKEFSPYTQISISRSDGIFILLSDPEGEMGGGNSNICVQDLSKSPVSGGL